MKKIILLALASLGMAAYGADTDAPAPTSLQDRIAQFFGKDSKSEKAANLEAQLAELEQAWKEQELELMKREMELTIKCLQYTLDDQGNKDNRVKACSDFANYIKRVAQIKAARQRDSEALYRLAN